MQHPNIKRLAHNTTIYAISNIGLKATSYLLIPLYTSLLSKWEFGLLSTLLLTGQVLFILMTFGANDCLIRFGKESQSARQIGDLLGTCFSTILLAGLLITACAILFFVPFFRYILHTDDMRVHLYLALTCLGTMAQCLCNQLLAYFRVNDSAIGFMGVGISSALILIAANFLFLKFISLGVVGALLAQIITYTTVFLVASLRLLPLTKMRISKALLKRNLLFSAPLVLSQLSWCIMGGSVVYFLSHYEGLESVATYSLGNKLAQITTICLIFPFQLAFDPFVFANLNSPWIKETMSRMVTYFLFACVAVSFVLFSFSRVIIALAAPAGYVESLTVFLLLLPTTIFLVIHMIGRTLLLIEHRTHIAGTVGVISAAVGLLLTHFLVSDLGIQGAVIATNLTYALSGTPILILGLRAYPLRLDFPRLALAMGWFGFMLVLFTALQGSPGPVFYGSAGAAALLGLVLVWQGGLLDDAGKAYLLSLSRRLLVGARQ